MGLGMICQFDLLLYGASRQTPGVHVCVEYTVVAVRVRRKLCHNQVCAKGYSILVLYVCLCPMKACLCPHQAFAFKSFQVFQVHSALWHALARTWWYAAMILENSSFRVILALHGSTAIRKTSAKNPQNERKKAQRAQFQKACRPDPGFSELCLRRAEKEDMTCRFLSSLGLGAYIL